MLFLLVLIWRIFLFLLAFISSHVYIFDPKFPYSTSLLIDSGLPQWLWGWGNFDGVHYLTIAQRGYFAQFTQVFFPLYPLILRGFSFITRDKFMILSGILVSLICTYIFVTWLYKLLLLDYDNKQSLKSVLFLLIFPTSFFLSAIYTESLFLLLVIFSFWFARKKKWLYASVCGGLAAGTRIVGIFLLPALLWEWYILYKNNIRKSFKINPTSIRKIIIDYLHSSFTSPLLYIIPVGIIAYMVYLQIEFKDFLYFWHAQSVFGAERTSSTLVLPFQVIWRYVKIISTVSQSEYHYWTAFWEFISFIFGVIMILVGHKIKIRFSYLIFSWFVIIIPTLTGTFSSMPRYILAAFPIFIVLALQKNYIQIVWGAISLGLLIWFTLQFIHGWWVA